MPPNPALDFLDAKHRLYKLWRDTWRMNERRAFGDYTSDLLSFVGESDDRYRLRQNRCTYVNFMQAHAQAVTGQLRSQGAPRSGSADFSFGSLGEIRPRSSVREDQSSFGERIYYNVDGVGDGSEWPVYFDSVDERAQHTGHRILMVETPPVAPVRPGARAVEEQPVVTMTDFLRGQRPYLVEFSPLLMPMWLRRFERFEFCILRVPQETGKVVDGKWVEPGLPEAESGDEFGGLSYYLLVRQGCTVLGSQYERGGYWLYSPEKKLLRTGMWGNTRGEIPLWYHYGEKSRGTVVRPAESRSSTEGLGRVSVSLMDMLSARDWDAFDAARSGKWFTNASPNVMAAVKEQWDAKSLHIGIPPGMTEAGESLPVTLTDDSAGAVAATVFQSIIDGKFAEAKEQSFQALTSLPGSSGYSKEMGYLEVKAPYLARRASVRQQSEQSAVRNFELRMGNEPRGFVAYKEEYNLTPVVEDIEAAIDMLRRNGYRSPTMEPELAIRAIKQRLGSLPTPTVPGDDVNPQGQDPGSPEAQEEAVRRELRESVEQAGSASAQDAALSRQFDLGV